MGTKSSTTLFPESRYYSILDYGYCKVWKRNDTHKQTMEQYDVSIENEDHLAKYKKMWQLRTQEQNIAGVYYFTHETPQQFCGVFQKGSILTERIPYRLSQFCNIPYEEALNIIKMTLESFKLLHLEYGLFHVRSTMIGVSFQNQIKVWLHTDLSSPEPENANCSSFYDMTDSIIQAVEINADTPDQYVRFSEFAKVNKQKIRPSFDEYLSALQIYKDMNNIPDYQGLPRLEYYLRRAEGWQQATLNNNFLSNIAQLNTDSPDRLAVVREESQKSFDSHKTKKNTASMNIYTHKEVNQLLQREKFLTRNLLQRERSQKSSTSQPRQLRVENSPLREQRQHFARTQNRENLLQRDSSVNVRFSSKSPSQQNKIEFKIIPYLQRRSNSPINQLVHQPTIVSIKPSHSSIENRLPPFPPRQSSRFPSSVPIPISQTIYTNNPSQELHSSQRKNRFEEKDSCPSKQSFSRHSSLAGSSRAQA